MAFRDVDNCPHPEKLQVKLGKKIQILTSWIQLSSSAVDSILLGSKVSEETLAAAIKVKQAKYITKDIGDSLL